MPGERHKMNTNNTPSVTIYHANAKGTGSAVRMALQPASVEAEGCIMLEIADQASIPNLRVTPPTFATFDWEDSILVRLDFNDLCKMLQVFRGEEEEIDYGNGLYHVSKTHATKIILRHIIEPVLGYRLYVSIIPTTKDEEVKNAQILFYPSEALGLCEAFAGSMSRICFG